MEREDIIILDCGFDMDEVVGPLGCCTTTFAPIRGF